MTIPDPVPELPPPSLRLRIDAAALAANWHAMDHLAGRAQTGAAVKANAYGAGVDLVVPQLWQAGARQFFVAHWGEVPAVLAHVPGAAIAVLHGVGNGAEARFAQAIGARPVLNSLHQIAVWQAAGGGPCHLMLDTGINRLGVAPAQIGDPLVQGLQAEIVMSHLACADEDSAHNARQLRLFHECAAAIDAPRRSLANSAGIALGPDYHFDLVRPGLALYGGLAHPALRGLIRQAVFVEAAVLQVRDLAPGDEVGYNATFRADRPVRAATVSLGYADGLMRLWRKDGVLHHKGRNLPVIGQVSMDLVAVDCNAAPDLKEGDFISLPYALPDAARATGLSQYELLTLLGGRFAREISG